MNDFCHGSGSTFVRGSLLLNQPVIGREGYYRCWACKRELKARKSLGSFRFLMLPRHKRPTVSATVGVAGGPGETFSGQTPMEDTSSGKTVGEDR